MNAITFLPQSVAEQNMILEFAKREKLEVLPNNDLDWLTPELMEMLDKEEQDYYNGIGENYSQEEMDQKHVIWKQERTMRKQSKQVAYA
jgi:hypothetical protein